MNLELEGKHVVIAGASKGIGFACAQAFLEEGATVSLIARSEPNLEAASRSLLRDYPDALSRIATFAADLRDAAAGPSVIDRAQAAFGPVDVLVNSAGAARRTAPEDLEAQHWHDAMDAKYFTYIHMLDPAIKRMAARGSGAVVNIIGAGGKVASPIHMPGGAANAALMLVSAGMAAAYGPRGVRVNAVNPGLTLTERLKEGLVAEARLNGITEDEALRRATARLPLRRIAQPREVADAVVFLASARASYINGAILAMDGAVTPMV